MIVEDRYIPSDQALRFIAFIRACATEDNANAEIHYRLADKYFSDSKQIVIESFKIGRASCRERVSSPV